MKKIIFERPAADTVGFDDIDKRAPIFAKLHGKLVGMVVKESFGWIIMWGGVDREPCHWSTLEACLENAQGYGYEFFVED